MKEMVVGFVFDREKEHVLLIQKKRPKWQAGLLNGIGGHIEEKETPICAMKRELEEETGLKLYLYDFINFLIINGSGWRVYFFFIFEDYENLTKIISPTDEKVILFKLQSLFERNDVIYNLKWMIPMALDEDLIRPIIIYDKTEKSIEGLEKVVIWKD